MDALAYAMKYTGSVTGRMASTSIIDESIRLAPSKVWSRHLDAYAKRNSIFSTLFNVKPSPSPNWRNHGAMRRALKATSSKHLVAFNQMSPARKDSFIQRVERHGKKQYPNQQHMRDLFAYYISERVTGELKD